MNRRAWSLFLLVSILWGIPYFLIKITLEDLSPIVVVAGRIAVGALVLLPVAALRGSLAALRGHARPVLALSVVHILIPFTLITYGETHISSSLTGLLIAIEPAVIALLMVRAEPLTRGRTTGLVLGFAGVAVLVGVDISGDRWGLLGAAMILVAALSYAVATMLVQRRLATVPAEALTAATTSISAVVLVPFALFALPTSPVSGRAWTALAVLGVFCTAVALLAFYQLIGHVGAAKAGLVTYVNPVVAVLLGVLLLDEHWGISTIAGFTLVAAGCWLSARPATPSPAEAELPAELAKAE
ncbi:DMT family transporter [Symbioplanes lichenis]|uniref:DMT family transporter n=1 Tax=Symbioplanes lichenis TaxID=1629072 RepID=UPI002738DC33|nr:DMT family transporter [Actinoplanes lichenis]